MTNTKTEGARQVLNETVLDIKGCPAIQYPLSEQLKGLVRYKYDFHIKKEGCSVWVYVDSFDRIDKWGGHKQEVANHGGQWRIVESLSAEVVESGSSD